MTRPLDGVDLQAYFRRLGYQRETQDLLIHIRTSPPSRTPGARRSNMPVWYPFKKMHCIIWRKTHVPKAQNLRTIYIHFTSFKEQRIPITKKGQLFVEKLSL